MTKLFTTAQIQVTVSVPASGSWGDQCTVEQIYRQAGEETVNKLQRAIKEIGSKVVGEPKVTSISNVEDKFQ